MNTSKALPRPGAKSQGLFSAINKHKVSYLFVAPYLLLFVLFTVLPVLIAVVLSFTSFNVLEPPEFVGFSNYSTLFFQDTVFIKGLQNTIVLAAILGPGGYLLSLCLAWFINELTPKVRAFVTLVFYAPSISGNVYLIWTVLFSGDDYGYVNSLLLKLGLIYQPVQWLQNANTVLIIVILV